MSKIKKQLLAGPYLIWIIGFIILPLFMIMYYAFKGSDGGFTFEYVAAIAQHTNIKALLLSLRLGIICTMIKARYSIDHRVPSSHDNNWCIF